MWMRSNLALMDWFEGKFYRRFMVFVLKDSSSSKSSFKTSLEWWKFAGWVTTQASCMGIIIKPQPYEATWVLIFDWWHRPPIEGVTTKWRDDAANLQVNYWTGAIRFVKSSVWKWANYTWNPICGHHVPYHCPKMGCTIFRRLSCDRLHGNHTIVLLVKGKPFSVAFPPKTRVFPPAFPSHPIRHRATPGRSPSSRANCSAAPPAARPNSKPPTAAAGGKTWKNGWVHHQKSGFDAMMPSFFCVFSRFFLWGKLIVIKKAPKRGSVIVNLGKVSWV